MNTFLTLYIEKLKIPHMYNTYLSILLQAWNYHLSLLLLLIFSFLFLRNTGLIFAILHFTMHPISLCWCMPFMYPEDFRMEISGYENIGTGYDVVLFSPDVQFSLSLLSSLLLPSTLPRAALFIFFYLFKDILFSSRF